MKTTLTTLVACLALHVGFSQSNDPCDGTTADFTTLTYEAAGGIKFTDNSNVNGSAAYTCQLELW